MNKTLIFGCALAFLGLSACSNDDMNAPAPAGSEVDVYFSASLPTELLTRAEIEAGYGDGTHAQNLQFAVYDKYGNYLFRNDQTYTFDATLHTQVKIRLVSGETYQIAFWAQNENAPYSFNVNNATVTADYTATNFTNNMEDMDAFFVTKTVCIDPLEPQLNQFAELTRATAQINIATADKSYFEGGTQAGLWPANSKLTLKNVPTAINLLDGSLTMPDNPEEETVFPMATLPTGKITVNNKDYDYLSLTYVLAPADGTVYPLVSMEVDKQTNGKRQYKNIPVRRNWQTNIVGNLLTSETLWDVYIRPAFEDEYNILISTEDELINALKEGGNYTLTQDLTLSELTAAGLVMSKDVTVDLNKHTLYIESQGELRPAFGAVATFENGKIVAKAGVYIPFTPQNDGTVLRFKNATIDTSACSYACQLLDNAGVEMEDCDVTCSYVGICTNADSSSGSWGGDNVNVKLVRTKITAIETPAYINVPGNVYIEDCELTGGYHGLLMRGGTATVKGSKLTANISGAGNTSYLTGNWKSANEAPNAALCLGNRSASAYRYPTNVTLENCTLTITGDTDNKFGAVYAWGNSEEGCGVTLTYDDACEFNGIINKANDYVTINH